MSKKSAGSVNKRSEYIELKKDVNRGNIRIAKLSVQSALLSVRIFFERVFGFIGKAFSAFVGNPLSSPVFIAASFAVTVLFVDIYGVNIKALFSLTMPASYIVYQLYLCDYGVGFVSRVLVGAVISLFKDKVSVSFINTVACVALIVSFVLQATIAGVTLRRAFKNKDRFMVFLCLFFLVCPLNLLGNVILFGPIDVFILILFLIYIITGNTYLSYISAPVICFVSMAIHYQFLLTLCFPLLALLLYRAICSERKSKRICAGTSFAVSSAVSAGSAVYFVFFANKYLKLTSDEFFGSMRRRLDISYSRWQAIDTFTPYDGVIYREYFDYYLFGKVNGKRHYTSGGDPIGYISNLIKEVHDGRISNPTLLRFCIISMALAVPVFACIWGACMVREKGKRKFPYFVFICLLLFVVPIYFFTDDLWRFFSAITVSQFALLFAVYADENSALRSLFKEKPFKKPLFGLGCIAYIGVYIYLTVFYAMK